MRATTRLWLEKKNKEKKGRRKEKKKKKGREESACYGDGRDCILGREKEKEKKNQGFFYL